MKDLQTLLNKYGESHINATNKMIHWICVPAIMFSLIGLLKSLPFFVSRDFMLNWGGVALIAALLYYLRLSIAMFLGFFVIGLIILWGNQKIWLAMDQSYSGLALFSIILFVVAWIGQFIGHKIEGKKPSFLEDLQFLLIGPAWLLHFIFEK
ncbi:MAG: Mpo1-like protein, partial [Saprospiraceae bacterium]